MESEKKLQANLAKGIKKQKGKCIILSAQLDTGIPDRLCLFPGGIIAFVELKSTGMIPRRKQRMWHSGLRRLGFAVSVIDTSEKLQKFLREPLNDIL